MKVPRGMRTAVEVVPKLGVKTGAPALRIGGVATYDRPIETGWVDNKVLSLGAEPYASRYVRRRRPGKREPAAVSGRS